MKQITRGFLSISSLPLSIKSIALILFFQCSVFAQQLQKTHIPGTSCIDCPKNSSAQKIGNGSVQNGNAGLGVTYNNTACGLNYAGGSVVLQQRSTSASIASPPVGSAQPATINISGIPPCATILKAYLYADASGNGVAINTNVTNPGGSSSAFPMAIIGTDVDKCWTSLGYAATYSYRADVTPIVTGNGNYQISGLPVYPAAGPNDVDGATLLIIYSDPAATYNGTLIIEDGAAVSIGSGLSGTISGYSAACANSNNASWFTIVADLQQLAQTDITINGSLNSFAAASDLWWNYITNPTTIVAGQTSSAYSFVNSGDCFNVEAIGFYYQTSCTVCTPAGNLTVTATPSSSCAGNTATAVITGGSGSYSYTWSPSGGNAATTTNIPGGTYTVTVKDNAGCNTGTQTVTVAASGSPILTVNSGTICNGSATTLTVSGATTYTWSPATGLSATSGTAVTANPTSSTTYTITGASGACTGTVSSVVTVNPLPTITITPGTVCNGASTTVTASGASTYTWSPATGLSATTGASVTANPPSTTSYTITGTDANGCVNTGTTSVAVISNPTVTVNSATICDGQQTATLTANGATTYAWSPATGLSATTGVTVTGTPASTTVYTITGTAGTCTAVATTTITVNPSPTVTVNSPTICNGSSAVLNAAGATTYTWSPATALSATSGASVNANPTSTTTYTITGAIGTCSNTNSSVVTVNALPTITVTPGSVCNGASTTLTASGASTYTWSPATGLSSTTGANVTANPATTTDYTITGTDVNGCVSTGTTNVFVAANPVLAINTSSICLGQQTATLTANGALTYVWTPATGLSATTGSVVTANPVTTTNYTITGSVGTCTATGTTTVTVNAIPVITVNTGTICIGQQTTNLTANGAATYSWIPATGLNATNLATVIANPNTTTSYTVGGVDANGCVSAATTTVTVNPLPSIAVSSTLICNGASATVPASGGVTYTWTPATGLSSTNGSPVTANPITTTIYSVTGTDANGCFNTDSATVTVQNNPIVTANTSTICVGQQTATLTANGANTYIWNPSATLSSPIGTSVTGTPATTTTYTITGTVGTCTSTATTTITVNTLPVIAIGSNSPVCVNQALNLTGSGALTYTWSGPNSFSSQQQNPIVPGITAAANGIYTLGVTDANTCTNVATVNVVINALPVVTATGATVCLNNTINLFAGGGVSYSWSGPNAFSSNIQNPSITNAAGNMSGSYVVTVTDANGCVNANAAQVIINALPVISANSASICLGQQTAALTASGASTYAWSPFTGLSSSFGTSVNASPQNSTIYTVTGTDVNNCQSTTTLTVTVNPLPLVAASPSTASGCAPVCVSFSNTAGTLGTCNWNFGDGTTSASCIPAHCFTGKGTFNTVFTLTDNNGCVNTSTATVVVYPVPVADFNATPQPTTILEPTIQFTNASGGATITSYSWSLGDPTNATSLIQNPSFIYQAVGTYPVLLVVTSNFGCIDSVTKFIKIDDEFMLYVPNAFSPNFDGTNDTFFAKGEGVKEFKMYIFDRWGNQIFFSDDILKGWDGRYLSKGHDIVQEDVYIWKIECKTTKGEAKMLKGHVSLIK
jgi:gliding motility-associated-like protein